MNKEFNCPVEATISLIGGKYKSVILFHLMGKTLRYSELHKRYRKPPINARTATSGTGKRRTYQKNRLSGCPAQTEYNLTEFGESLSPILMPCVTGESPI